MKKLLIMTMASLLMFCGCKKTDTEQGTLTMKVSVSQERMDKSSTLSRNTSRICYQVLQNGAVVANGTQQNTDADYGNISVDLAVGTYTIVVMANKGNAPTMNTNGTYTYSKVGDAFAGNATFSISRDQRTTISVPLVRVVSQLNFTSTDPIPSSVTHFQVIVDSICSTYDVLTALGSDKAQYASSIASRAGMTTTFGSYTYMLTEGQDDEVDLRLLFFSASGDTLFDRYYENVPVERNYRTNLTAAMFHEHGSDPVITIDTTWAGNINVDL